MIYVIIFLILMYEEKTQFKAVLTFYFFDAWKPLFVSDPYTKLSFF